MSYKVAFLNDEDFERLPGTNMGSKVGVAYPKYGEAYVRKSGSNLVDVFSAMHELEHLEGSSRGEHFDSENQCYYKSFMDALSPILGIGGSMFGGPAGGAVGNGIGQLFGGGRQQKPQENQQQQGGFFNPGTETTQPMAPATSMAQGAGGGAGAGPIGGTAIRGLSQMPQFQQQNAGNYSGRSPLMNAFGGQ